MNIEKDKRYAEVDQDTRKSFLISDCDSKDDGDGCLNLYQGRLWCFGGGPGHETSARG